TLMLLKPDAVARQLVGRIIDRFEAKGLKIIGMKMLRVSAKLAGQLYRAHRREEFYQPLVEFITAGPVIAMVAEGVGAIEIARSLMGSTFGPEAAPGTIRGDFGASKRYNLVHGCDSQESAAREIPMFFSEDELLDYDPASLKWVYARADGELI
ncbi:MAG: nucleoside-diphosphate kinase, partial [Phycisphaerae bacterium]|nr:nucleoside-diphosphate kinase [Phycisphaerae bacterium]